MGVIHPLNSIHTLTRFAAKREDVAIDISKNVLKRLTLTNLFLFFQRPDKINDFIINKAYMIVCLVFALP